jgi:hypothetical protein
MKEILRKIKYSRLKPEERFLIDIFSNLTEYKINSFPNSLFYKYNNETIMEYYLTDCELWVYYPRIYPKIWQFKNNMKNYQIRDLIGKLAKEYLKLEYVNVLPRYHNFPMNNNRMFRFQIYTLEFLNSVLKILQKFVILFSKK